jgi:hypothetical protein
VKLVYFSPVAWASFRQRPHEFADWFQRRLGGPVLWVEPYPVRLPRAADLRRPSVAATGQGESPSWLQRVQPVALPGEPLALGRHLNRLLAWPRVMDAIEAFAGTDKCVIAIGKPSDLAWQALTRFSQWPSIYDAMDDFSAFHDGIAQHTVARIESDILRRVTMRCTTSTHIAARMRAQGLQVEVVPNGVASARLPAPKQGDGGGPIGYVGTVAAWFDWPWVAELAASWPDRKVEIHGPVFQAPTVRLPANVELHPALPHEEALLRMRSFCAGLVPFLRNELTESVDPVKFYEYRALGLPVIGTPFGEMPVHAQDPRVVLTEHPAQSRGDVESLLAGRDTAESVAGFRRRHDWLARFEPLAPLVEALT